MKTPYIPKSSSCSPCLPITNCDSKKLSIFPAQLAFNNVQVGTVSVPQNIIITNNGNSIIELLLLVMGLL